jgi:hypothetical protein
MKRPHEMMNPISKRPSSISAVKGEGRGMKNHQGIPLFTPPFFYNRPMIDRRKYKTTNRRQKSNKEERSQDFPLSDDMFRAAPMYVGGPRRGRLIHWLNLPGDSPDRLFCFLRGGKEIGQ